MTSPRETGMEPKDEREWQIGLCGEQPYAFPADRDMSVWSSRGDEIVPVVPKARLLEVERERDEKDKAVQQFREELEKRNTLVADLLRQLEVSHAE